MAILGASKPPRPLDLNQATAEALIAIPGIGPTLAARIVESRRQEGRFRDVAALLRVRGIGPVRLAEIRPFVSVEPEAEANPKRRREEQRVEEASVVGRDPEQAPARADEPTRIDQEVHAE